MFPVAKEQVHQLVTQELQQLPGRRWVLPASFVGIIILFVIALPWLPAFADRSGYYGVRVDLHAEPLPGASGQPLVPPDDGVDVVFFGFQQCGTVCPLQLVNLMELQRRLQGEPVRFVFVTLDPERDSTARLNEVMAGLGPHFVAVRPESGQQARQLASRYHDYAAVTGVGEAYDIEHSGHLHVVSRRGRRELLYTNPELDLDRVTEDLVRLLSELQMYPEYAHL